MIFLHSRLSVFSVLGLGVKNSEVNKRQRLEPRTEIIALEGRTATLLSIPYSDCIKRFSTFLDASTGLRNNNIQPNKNDLGNAKVRRLFLPKPACVSWGCRKGEPFQGPKLGSCLTLRNELSEETHVLRKQEILLGRGARVESRRVREPRRNALPHGLPYRVSW